MFALTSTKLSDSTAALETVQNSALFLGVPKQKRNVKQRAEAQINDTDGGAKNHMAELYYEGSYDGRHSAAKATSGKAADNLRHFRISWGLAY